MNLKAHFKKEFILLESQLSIYLKREMHRSIMIYTVEERS